MHITDKLSIEHIFPQTPEYEAWPELSDEEQDIIHTFGNLTLLTNALNASVSNGPFVQKRKAIVRQSKLRLNAQFQELADQDRWSLDDIKQRGGELFAQAREIWPRPDVQPTMQLSPGKKRTLNSLLAIAQDNGVGEAFEILMNAALDNYLYPRPSKKSVMYTPPENKNQRLYTVRVMPRDGLLRVYIATGAFSEFFPLNDSEATDVLGEAGWHRMTPEDSQKFAEKLAMLVNQ